MKRTLVLLACAVIALAGVVAIQRLNQDRLYRSLLAEGDRAMRAGHAYLAVEAFSGALALKRDSMVAHYRRGEAYAAERQDVQAIRDLREARRLAPDAPEPLEALGRLYDRRGEYALAADWYDQAAARLHDTDARLLYSLALARYRTGALAAARHAVRRALARDDSLAEAHYLLGLVSRDMQHERDALSSLEQAVRLDPSLAAARYELASLHRARGRQDEEIAQLRALVSLDAQVGRHVALAMAHMRVGSYDQALHALDAAEASSPGSSRVALAVGRVHLAHAEASRDADALAQALEALERALGGTARRSEGLALYGRALSLSGDLAGAERLLQEAVRTSPVDPSAFGFLADAAEALRHPLVARDALISLDALEGTTAPSDVRAERARRIGALSLDGDDAPTGLEFLTRATRAGHASASTLGLLARAQSAVGRHDEAHRTLDDALALAPDDADLLRLREALTAR